LGLDIGVYNIVFTLKENRMTGHQSFIVTILIWQLFMDSSVCTNVESKRDNLIRLSEFKIMFWPCKLALTSFERILEK